MTIAFLYALGFLIIFPLIAGWEAFGILGIIVGSILSWIIIGFSKACETSKKQDHEFLGTFITEARYYEPWTEKIEHEDEETGKITYEEVEHYEEWEATTAEGDILSISESEYQKYVSIFNNEEEDEADHEGEAEGEIIDPGSCFITTWPGTYATACYKYVSRSYKNSTLGASNVYQSEKLSKEDIKQYHLKPYDCKSLYGTVYGPETKLLENQITDYNCWSRTKNIKLNFILLKNAKSTQAMYWQQYWNNGKRNTINVVVGLNNKNKIEWAHAFGWQNEAVCIKLRNFIAGLKTLSDITDNFNEIENILNKNYKLPDFSQYDFVQSQYPLKGTIITLTICLGIFCCLFCRPPQYNARAYKYLEKEEYQLAKESLQKVLFYEPNEPHALNNLAIIYWRENDFEKAEKLFEKAVNNISQIEIDKQYYLYLNRGIFYKTLKQNKKAIAEMKEAISKGYEIKSYCSLYSLYKTLGYKKSMRSLKEGYYRDLKDDCKYYEDKFLFLEKPTTPIDERGFLRLLEMLLK